MYILFEKGGGGKGKIRGQRGKRWSGGQVVRQGGERPGDSGLGIGEERESAAGGGEGGGEGWW